MRNIDANSKKDTLSTTKSITGGAKKRLNKKCQALSKALALNTQRKELNRMYDPIIANEALPVNEESAKPSGIQHGFDTGYAIAYGVDEAIMIRNLQFFITSNANRGNNFREGKYWTYDRLEDFPNHFPYWSVKQVRRIIASLIEQEVIVKEEFNEKWSDRTQWYAFKDENKFIKNTVPPKEKKQAPSDLPKRATESCPNGHLTDVEMGNCYNDTSSIPSQISSKSSLKVPEEPIAAKAAEVDSNPPSKPKREKPDFPPKVREVANQMVNALHEANPHWLIPKNLHPMMVEIEKMIADEKRDPKIIVDVFMWTVSDSFWMDKLCKPNPAKYLRGQFGQLAGKMNAKPFEQKKERKFAPCSNDDKAYAMLQEMTARAI